MIRFRAAHRALLAVLVGSASVLLAAQSPQPPQSPPAGQGDGFKFHAGVELINVTATVTDSTGRFVPGLKQEDFTVYEDELPQTITHFSAERVPVSLGLVLDTSGSMAGEKWDHATDALNRFLLDLLVDQDEVFLYRFSNDPVLVENWTTNREQLSRAISRIFPRGGTAMYDALADAVPMADTGHNRKKAVVVISDGNDTNSRTTVQELKQLIHETEVLVYAVGIDGEDPFAGPNRKPPVRLPYPFPAPGGRGRPWPGQPPAGGYGDPYGGGNHRSYRDERVNGSALRELTDDSGGRTEIVTSSRDLEPATSNIADELSKQYFLAYPAAAKKDGRWHTIRVQVRNPNYTVRARRGYMAS